MATTFSYVRRFKFGLPGPTIHSSGTWPSSWIKAKITGPATSVSDGMTLDLASDFNEIYSVLSISQVSGGSAKYLAREVMPTSNTASALKIRVWNLSTGALVTGGTDLSGESWYCDFVVRDNAR